MISGTERVAAQIDLDALHFNVESMKANLKEGTKMAAVIKTDGYGHGAVPIARELENIPYIWGYAVATFEEAKELRDAGLGKPILILGYVFPYCYEQLSELEIRPACFREDMLDELSEAAKKTGKDIRIHIALDTAMGRIGIRPDDAGLSFVDKAFHTEHLIVEGMFTHFSKADEIRGRDNTERQIREYTDFTQRIRQELGCEIPIHHCSNSAGIVDYPDANFDMVRAGITLYGLWPSAETSREPVPLRPLLSLKSHVVYLKDCPKGTTVSYGGTYTTTGEHTQIATVPVGYGDGYPRSLSNKGYVLIRGHKAPVVGRVCMDQLMVDVTDIPGASMGDEAVLIGTQGDETITMEELGDLSGRFNYELACDINSRVPRIYIRSGQA